MTARPPTEWDAATYHAAFVEAVVAAAEADAPPYVLDYWRLNIWERRPVV